MSEVLQKRYLKQLDDDELREIQLDARATYTELKSIALDPRYEDLCQPGIENARNLYMDAGWIVRERQIARVVSSGITKVKGFFGRMI